MGANVFFILTGAILVFAMHAGFAFLEVGTVRQKNQVNAMVKILSDFAIAVVAYFLIGYSIAYGVGFFSAASNLVGYDDGSGQGYGLVKFFFLATFAAAIGAIISGGVAERMRFFPQALAVALLIAFVYPFFEGIVWGGNYGIQTWLGDTFGAPFNDFAGSVVVHAVGGFLGLAAVLQLGPRRGRYRADGKINGIPPSSIPWLALGSWLLCVGWFGFNVMSAQSLENVSGLVALNSLMAMVGGIIAALVAGRGDPGFVHNGALAGLVAVCAGSNVMHPIGSLIVGGVAGVIFVFGFEFCQNRLKIDDVLGVWPLHGLCGAWGGLAAGIFGLTGLGGMGGVAFMSQLIGTLGGAAFAFIVGTVVYAALKATIGIRLSPEDEDLGADLAIHRISAAPESDVKA
jgi:Amt family ammonium transporter